ncbi:type II toxin-antitoxin system Phd/YefM family antitoxin [Acidobacteria bacterium AB60]|nr:type II toxin-antitoxin system Phd/YefM family antitoxin [Acidobacteria bacterium AB60]
MKTVNIHEAKTHLSRLVDAAERGEDTIIAKAGKPKARLVRFEGAKEETKRRIGFLKGKIKVPDDFDTMFAEDIEKMFRGES